MKTRLSIYLAAASLAILPSLSRADDTTTVQKTDKTTTVQKDGDGVTVTKDKEKQKVDQGTIEHRDDHHDRKVEEREHRDDHHDRKVEEREHRVEPDAVKKEKDVTIQKDGGDTKVEVDKTKKIEKP